MLRRVSAGLVVTLVVTSLLHAAHHDEDPVFGQISSIVQSLSDITGLREEHSVAYGTISKKQLRHFLRKRIKKTLKPDEIRADEIALKLFGLVPQDFDLKKSTIDLLTEQAAAFYDYDEKKLFLLRGASLEDETTTLAHELSHALADQHFNLEQYMDESPTNDDENLAHTAVVEGQASWLMLAYNLVKAGQPPEPSPQMLKAVEDSSETSASDYPVLKASPLYIQQSLLFPYTDGTAFFDAVFKKMGKAAFQEVFVHAPVDSAQIFHPERYFAHEKPVTPELPKLRLDEEADDITDGTLGEFDHRMLLWQYLGEARASALAAHLRGSQFRVLASGKKGRPILQYVSTWDSETSAADFFGAYKEVLRGKWKQCEPSTDTGSAFAGKSESGFFVTHLSGDSIVSVEGLASSVEWARLKNSATETGGKGNSAVASNQFSALR